GERPLHLGRRDRHRLERSDHIREPEAHELHAALFDGAQHEVSLLVHAHTSSSSPASDGLVVPHASSAASSSAHARERSRSFSGAFAASSAVSNGPTRSTAADCMPNSTSRVLRLNQYFSSPSDMSAPSSGSVTILIVPADLDRLFGMAQQAIG